MKAYLAGKMTGIADNNFPAFRDAAKRLRAEGWDIISPVELDEDEGIASTATLGDPEYKDALSRDLRKLMDVEAIILLPGWETSRGARTELSLARHYDLHVFYYQGNGLVSAGPSIGRQLFNEETEYIEDPVSGGRKGRKNVRPELIPWEAQAELGYIYAQGAKKYDANNWKKGYDYSLSIGAMKRHILRFEAGEDIDPEGFHHMAAVMFHAAALIYFQARNKGTDDRDKA